MYTPCADGSRGFSVFRVRVLVQTVCVPQRLHWHWRKRRATYIVRCDKLYGVKSMEMITVFGMFSCRSSYVNDLKRFSNRSLSPHLCSSGRPQSRDRSQFGVPKAVGEHVSALFCGVYCSYATVIVSPDRKSSLFGKGSSTRSQRMSLTTE
jgi:hypothetical protein